MSDGQTVLGSYPFAFLAHVARTRLQEEGIPAAAWDDYGATTFSFDEARAIGGARLVVPTSEAERAQRILAAPMDAEQTEDAAMAADSAEPSLPQFDREQEPPQEEVWVCPNCAVPQAVAEKARSRVVLWGVATLGLGPWVLFGLYLLWFLLWFGVHALWGIAESSIVMFVLLGATYTALVVALVVAIVVHIMTRRRPQLRCASCQRVRQQRDS